jgi:hypothetical protein
MGASIGKGTARDCPLSIRAHLRPVMLSLRSISASLRARSQIKRFFAFAEKDEKASVSITAQNGRIGTRNGTAKCGRSRVCRALFREVRLDWIALYDT